MRAVYSIDLKKLSILILPTFMRGSIIRALLISAIRPLLDIYRSFTTLFFDSQYKLSHNGQVCYLRKVLNDTFDVDLRRINIQGVIPYEPIIFEKESEQNVVTFQKGTSADESILFITQKLIGSEIIDFVVQVPTELQIQEIHIKSIIDYYRLASKRYKINYF